MMIDEYRYKYEYEYKDSDQYRYNRYKYKYPKLIEDANVTWIWVHTKIYPSCQTIS